MYLDMIGEQHKKDHEQEKKEARTALEQGQERVVKRGKMGFKRYKKRNLAKFEIWKGEE